MAKYFNISGNFGYVIFVRGIKKYNDGNYGFFKLAFRKYCDYKTNTCLCRY